MTWKRLRALAYLAWRALLAHPVKKLARRGTGLDRFAASYEPEGLVPTAVEEREVGALAGRCIGCGLCELGCELASAAPSVRALGLPAAFRLYGRSSAELPLAREALEACRSCAGCEPLCPTGVPIGRIVRYLQERAVELPAAAASPPIGVGERAEVAVTH